MKDYMKYLYGNFLLSFALTLLFSTISLQARAMNNKSLPPLEEMIGSMVLIGFEGTKPEDPTVQLVSSYAEKGMITGVLWFSRNVETPEQVKALSAHFKSLKTLQPLLNTLDFEGGLVQRLAVKKSFHSFLSPKEVSSLPLEEAKKHFKQMASYLKSFGFNYNLAPVVDLDSPTSKVIGALGRSYSETPEKVIAYARAFIEAMREEGLLTSLKHFPGHGYAQIDSHESLVHLDGTYSLKELAPFYGLAPIADSVMVGHLILSAEDANWPATLSSTIIPQLLRAPYGDGNHLKKLMYSLGREAEERDLVSLAGYGGYEGVVIADDYDMGAIASYNLKTILKQALAADVDILIFSRNPLANKSDIKKEFDPRLPERIIEAIKELIADKDINEDRIARSYRRITKMKSLLQRGFDASSTSFKAGEALREDQKIL